MPWWAGVIFGIIALVFIIGAIFGGPQSGDHSRSLVSKFIDWLN